MSRTAPLAVLVAALLLAAPAAADTTLDRTIRPVGSDAFQALGTAPGERHVLRRGAGIQPVPGRAGRRASLLNFAQLTDPQIADEMSPARVDFVDPAGGEVRSAHRPQEAMGLQVLDQVVRSINANPRSPVRQGDGTRARLRLAITTGDLADNQQLNETRWFRDVLDGARIDPFSGRAIGPGQRLPAGDAGPGRGHQRRRRRAPLHGRAGLRRLRRLRPPPARRSSGTRTTRRRLPSPYAAFPRYPGLMDRAQARFTAAGLDVPWYISRGNHDGLIQGNAPGQHRPVPRDRRRLPEDVPERDVRPRGLRGRLRRGAVRGARRPGADRPAARRRPPRGARPGAADHLQAGVPLDRRRYATASATRPPRQLTASRGAASYYAWIPRPGLRFISLDTVAEGGGDSGNLDHPQYVWLRGELRRATRRGELVVAFGHHTLGTMNNARTDELAGACQPADEPGCDRDPRRSTPLHRGTEGARTVAALFAAAPNLIAYVAGSHARQPGRLPPRAGRRRFWEINTASHIDWPQQSRLIDIMDNRDGTLSLFGTVVDHSAPLAVSSQTNVFSPRGLASLARTLSWNDPQREGVEGSEGEAEKSGTRRDRNVELLLRDPRGAAAQVPPARCADC